MGVAIRALACYGKSRLSVTLDHFRCYWSSGWILSRTACLGNDVFEMLDLSMPRLNTQKGRVDYLHGIADSHSEKIRAIEVFQYLHRKDIYQFLIQEEVYSWNHRCKPLMFFMDSFAELTDQQFTHRKRQWSFYCHYSDLNVTDSFKEKFSCDGLMSVDDMYCKYIHFFEKVRKMYGDIPIIFLHFPTKLDDRRVFHHRAEAILKAIEDIASNDPQLYSISIDDSCVGWPENIPEDEKFPYHFNHATYSEFSNKIKRLGICNEC